MREDPARIATARRLRRDMTVPEARLWQILRGRRVAGMKFRHQHAIGPYYADFCCVLARLVVEVDGDSHLGRQTSDGARDEYMRRQGYAILRVENRDVMFDETRVVELIVKALRQQAEVVGFACPLTPSPSPPRERGTST